MAPQIQTGIVWSSQTRGRPSIPIFGGGRKGEGEGSLFDHETSTAENSAIALGIKN